VICSFLSLFSTKKNHFAGRVFSSCHTVSQQQKHCGNDRVGGEGGWAITNGNPAILQHIDGKNKM